MVVKLQSICLNMSVEPIQQNLEHFQSLFTNKEMFEESFASIQQVIACRVIGDDVTYNRFFSKHLNAKDENFVKIQEHIQRFALLRRNISKLADTFELSGFVRISNMIKFVTSGTMITNEQGHFWSICALTGKTCSEVSIWKSSEKQLTVDMQYEPFLLSIWAMYNLEDIEIAKASRFLIDCKSSVPQGTMRELIEVYVSNTETMQYQNIYWNAMSNIITTLQKTIQIMQSGLHEVA